MSIHFKIDYSRWSTDDTSPINADIKIKQSHNRLVSNYNTSIRNKTTEIREKVSNGVKKFYKEKLGTIEERFINNIIKQKNGCWNFKHTHFYDEDGNQLQPKEYSLKYHNISIPENTFNISTNCNNPKCINPEHIIFMTKDECAKNMRDVYKNMLLESGNRPHNSKLSNDDLENIRKMYLDIFQKNGGKHRGIASEIHLKYSNVTLALITSICNSVKPKHLIDNTPILMYEFDDNTNTKGKFIKKYSNIDSAVFDESREKKELVKRNIWSVLQGKTNRTGHGKNRRGGYVFEYEN